MDTSTLRQQIRTQRRALAQNEREQADFAICERIARSRLFQKSRHIACYLSNDGEVNLQLLIEHAWQQGKQVYLPVLAEPNTRKLWFVPWQPGTTLVNNRFGIPEPLHSRKIRSRKVLSLDMILMPLVAFDEQGNRMGMGGGFYDRTLAFLQYRKHWYQPQLLGIAYELQKVAQLERQHWDIPLQSVVTEQHFYRSQR